MKDNRINAFIAGIALVAAILMCAALSFAIGKWSFGTQGNTYTIKFPNATGITPNSEVKFAGAHAGKVTAVRLIPRKDQDEDPHTGLFNCVEVVVLVDKSLELGDDVGRDDQAGRLRHLAQVRAAHSRARTMTAPIWPTTPRCRARCRSIFPICIQPAGEALSQAKVLISELQPALKQVGPMIKRLNKITDRLQPVIDHTDKLVQDGDSVLGNFNTPAGHERIQEMMTSLAVSTENLKVVSYNAKALTATLAAKPWRVFWGGATVPPPSENQALDSTHVIHLQARRAGQSDPRNNCSGGL